MPSRVPLAVLGVLVVATGSVIADMTSPGLAENQRRTTLTTAVPTSTPRDAYLPLALALADPLDTPIATPRPTPTVRPGALSLTEPQEPRPPADVFASCVVRDEIGTVGDESVGSVRTTTYNDRSHKIREVLDKGADGSVDSISERHYDDFGRLLKRTYDADADGSLDAIHLYMYNERGQLVRDESWIPGEPAPEGASEYEYNEAGNLAREMHYVRAADDLRLVRTLLYYYDEDGRRLRWDTSLYNHDTPDSADAYAWVGDVITQELHDSGADGSIDSVMRYSYDELNRMVLAESADSEDGIRDSYATWQHEQHGWVIRYDNYTSHWENTLVWDYDPYGRLIEKKGWSWAGPGIRHRFTYTCP